MSMETTPRRKAKGRATRDVGWRKASVVLVAMACVTALKIADRLDGETLATILGLAGSYVGINVVGYLRGTKRTV